MIQLIFQARCVPDLYGLTHLAERERYDPMHDFLANTVSWVGSALCTYGSRTASGSGRYKIWMIVDLDLPDVRQVGSHSSQSVRLPRSNGQWAFSMSQE